MSIITQNSKIGSSFTRNAGSKVNAGLRVLVCASLAMAITSLTAQVIGSATSANQTVRQYAAVSAHAAAPLSTVAAVTAR